MTKTFEELEQAVSTWAHDRNIILGAKPIKQAHKTLEECGELIEAVANENTMETVDAIGDITVTLLIQCEMQGINFLGCLESAYNTIKDRKGRMINGKFVKEESIA